MKGKKYIFFFVAALLVACSPMPEAKLIVRACAPMPDGGRASACACVMDGKAYVFAGRDKNQKYHHDLWQYDPDADRWTSLGNTPMNGRVNAVITAEGGKLYAGLGYSALRAYKDTAYQQDWWEYTPATGQWRRLADFPSNHSVAGVPVALHNKIYVLYGCGHDFTREVNIYDIESDSWTTLPYNAARAQACFGGKGALIGEVFYFGTGFNAYNLRQWYRADLTTDHWEHCASIPGKGRQFSACAGSDSYIYLFGGRHFAGELTGGEVFDTYMRYSPAKDQWEWCGTMPCGRVENLIAFSINGTPYFGLGEDDKGQVISTLYRIEE